MIKVSVIIPNYNHAKFLAQRIDSVLNQTYQDFEVIILDDFSTDHSKQIIENYRSYPKVSHIIYNNVNSGSTFKQWQKGILLAKGEYIWIAESDDYAETNFLEKLIEIHLNNNRVGIAYSKSYPINETGEIYDISDWWMKRIDENKWEQNYINNGLNECQNFLVNQCTIPNVSAVLFKKIVFHDIKFLDITYKVCGDWYIYSQILKNFDIAYTIDTINYHRNHFQNARSANYKIIVLEQISVLKHIVKDFKINKSKLFYSALDEKLGTFLSLIKQNEISIREIIITIKNLYEIQSFFMLRLVKVSVYKLLGLGIGFNNLKHKPNEA